MVEKERTNSQESSKSSKEILGARIDATNYQQASELICSLAKNHVSAYIIAANVHVVMTGYWRSDYQTILRGANLVTPDGMPLVWGLRLLGIEKAERVYGPDLMLACCERAEDLGIPIYLYGGKELMLLKLEKNLKEKYPNLLIAGSFSPPFRPLTPAEEKTYVERIIYSGAKIVFVALGCPKQEEWMARQVKLLPAVMIGVGAAFSFHSGEVSQAPRWMMKLGLEWLYRFLVEPRRLFLRYLINNPAFVILFSLELLKQWLFPLKSSQKN